MPIVVAEITIEVEIQYFIDPKTGAQYLKYWIAGNEVSEKCREWVAENSIELCSEDL